MGTCTLCKNLDIETGKCKEEQELGHINDGCNFLNQRCKMKELQLTKDESMELYCPLCDY